MGIPAPARERNAARPALRVFTATVAARTLLAPAMARITLRAPEFADFRPVGPDEFFGLIIPKPGGRLPAPSVGADLREVLLGVPEPERPDLRWYTVRRHRPESREVDVDMVLHGDNGPASAWAGRARVGDVVGFRESAAGYLPPSPTARRLLLADETGLPAVSAIVESEPAEGRTALVEVADHEHAVGLDGAVTWVPRGDAPAGAPLLAALDAIPGDVRFDYAWICGEGSMVAAARSRVLARHGVHRDHVMFSGYWSLGRARL